VTRYECWAVVKVGFPIEVEADDEYEAEDIANEKLERIVKRTYRLREKLEHAIEWYEPEDYEVISCERID